MEENTYNNSDDSDGNSPKQIFVEFMRNPGNQSGVEAKLAGSNRAGICRDTYITNERSRLEVVI